MDVSDPSWAPYWPNYKMLKKLIKELPSLVPLEDGFGKSNVKASASVLKPSVLKPSQNTSVNKVDKNPVKPAEVIENHCSEQKGLTSTHEPKSSVSKKKHQSKQPKVKKKKNIMHLHADLMSRSVGEKTFFRLLFEELGKTKKFFDQAQKEFSIREERLQVGVKIVKKPHPFMLDGKWSCLAKSVYNLYKDLLLLETYAIMSYCSFSKILKKHDKVTGYETRKAFMENVVNNANFTTYPVIVSMIRRTELLYEEVSENLRSKGKEGLGEDERLFINMIHKLNLQIMHKAEPDCVVKKESNAPQSLGGTKVSPEQLKVPTGCKMINSIRDLVVENEAALVETSSCLSDDLEAKAMKDEETEEKPKSKLAVTNDETNISVKREGSDYDPTNKSKRHRVQ